LAASRKYPDFLAGGKKSGIFFGRLGRLGRHLARARRLKKDENPQTKTPLVSVEETTNAFYGPQIDYFCPFFGKNLLK